ncbi:CAP domain-containing protein [Kallotenue papyrolyticum]|uniref:CAP domain-containing protein n=1 Tax=Kallotenue papyrolyticum TaxID=1325125 RepID=UPI00047855F0|nr:CAP domain-containing protein [Kallotenue papyrolyticum]
MCRSAHAGLVAALGLSLALGLGLPHVGSDTAFAEISGSRKLFLPQIVNSTATEQSWSAAEREALEAINGQRRAVGCAALASNAELHLAARRHSEDMARNNYFSHASLDGSSFVDRARAAGYAYWPSGETIAAGYERGTAVVQGWLNSAGHRAILLDCANDDVGIGLAFNAASQYGWYWTAVFGRR